MRVISWGLPEDCHKKTQTWEKLFLFQVCLASLRKKFYRPLLMHEVTSAECLHFSSSCDLTTSSNLKTLIQTIFVTLTILTKTRDITLSIGVKMPSLFHTQYWITSLIRQKETPSLRSRKSRARSWGNDLLFSSGTGFSSVCFYLLGDFLFVSF